MTVLTRKQAKELTDKVLSMSKADEAELSLSGGRTTHIRFARNTPSTSGEYSGPTLRISSIFGKRTGTVSVNQFDDASLETAVRRSEEIARLAPEDREHMPAIEPQSYPTIDGGFDEATAREGAETLARGVATCLEQAKRRQLQAAGFTQSHVGYSAIANSNGNFGYHTETQAYVSETARVVDPAGKGLGSGWASDSAVGVGQLDYAQISQQATDKAKASVEPKEIEPGKYVTILEPACVANLVANMMYAMDARSADEGRSYFSNKGGTNRMGEKLFDRDIHIFSDPHHEDVPGSPWGSDGVPQKRVDWIEAGALEQLRYDRFWAEQAGVAPVPFPSNVIMKGGDGDVDSLVASTKRGVLVTSLWYIRSVDPRSLLYTGLTRDGVFWIENGKISHPVTNFRWNDSPISVLKNVVAMSRSVQVPPRPWRSRTYKVPALKVREFHFSSVSEAV